MHEFFTNPVILVMMWFLAGMKIGDILFALGKVVYDASRE